MTRNRWQPTMRPTGRGLAIVIVALLGVLGCAGLYLGQSEPSQVPLVTDAVEVASQFSAHQVLLTNFLGDNVHDAVRGAFMRTASIKLEFHETNTNLLPTTDWPDPDSPQGFSYFETFAREHHDTQHYRWIIFYVNHTVHNDAYASSCLGYGAAISSVNLANPNNAYSDPALRWTFVFLTDIQLHEGSICTPAATSQQLRNYVTTVVTHEFGHQRAGLTENYGPNHDAYHQGSVPSGRADVMEYDRADAYAHADPVFDASALDAAGNHTTCRGNLLTNRSVQ